MLHLPKRVRCAKMISSGEDQPPCEHGLLNNVVSLNEKTTDPKHVIIMYTLIPLRQGRITIRSHSALTQRPQEKPPKYN